MDVEYEGVREAAERLGKDRGWFQKKIYEGRVADKEGNRPVKGGDKRWNVRWWVPVEAEVLPPHPREYKWPEAKRRYYRIKQREHREQIRKEEKGEAR